MIASHIKAKGANYWGSSAAAISLIERARQRGVDVWADQYPYSTSGTDGSTVLIPDWAVRSEGASQGTNGRAEALRKTIADPKLLQTLRSDVAHEIARRGGAENVVVYEYTDKSLYGKPLAEIAKRWRAGPVEAAIRIQLDGLPNRAGGARMRGFSMHENDMEAFAKQSWVATSTDAGISLPEGMAADLVVLDLGTIRDKATFFEPHQYSEGVEHVFVNGVAVVDGSKITWSLPGKLITR
ncbi:MAG: hypothetical protein M3541_16200 [Acidobacteriota bacterium]|nr:hypothetical protein [Acidobacteriota bacterium]MDQ3420289.1 hypothetical protein [Acidobacteriota bacterium]